MIEKNNPQEDPDKKIARDNTCAISVIVPTKNAGVGRLQSHYDSINECMKSEDFEVIYVDQTDGRETSDTVIGANCVHLFTQVPKSAISARQFGAERAKYPNLLFCDDDVSIDCQGFSLLCDFLRSGEGCSYSVVSPILFDSSHTAWFVFIRAIIEVGVFGAGDKRAINRALEWFGLPHVKQNYLWGGAFLTNANCLLNGTPIIQLVKCEGEPIQHGDILLGMAVVNSGGSIKTLKGLRSVHHDPNYAHSPKFIDARMKQADYEGYNKLQRLVYKLLLKASVFSKRKLHHK